VERRHELAANAHRFGGFADLYDRVRPTPPAAIADVIASYAGRRPSFVVDLGSGTGLSTRWAAGWAAEVVGIEPSHDMRERAAHVTNLPRVRYLSGWSDETGLPDRCADAVLAVQALHWMEPAGTFAEVARLLRPGGVFAAIDCDWPPTVGDPAIEAAWSRARATIAIYERRLAAGHTGDALAEPVHEHERTAPTVTARQTDDLRPMAAGDPPGTSTIAEGVRYWHKGDHLRRLGASGRFSYCGELCAVTDEVGDAARLVDLLCSQGDYQTLRRHGVGDDALGVEAFAAEAHDRLGPTSRTFWFTYRARLAIR
jgi:SAM-dependent methyltransferase